MLHEPAYCSMPSVVLTITIEVELVVDLIYFPFAEAKSFE